MKNIFLSFITGIVTQACMCAETEFDLKKYIVPDYTELSYGQRKEYALNEIGKKLFEIMHTKKQTLQLLLILSPLNKL